MEIKRLHLASTITSFAEVLKSHQTTDLRVEARRRLNNSVIVSDDGAAYFASGKASRYANRFFETKSDAQGGAID